MVYGCLFIRQIWEVCALRPTTYFNVRMIIVGRLAQLVRAPLSHSGGHWFESSIVHHKAFVIRPSIVRILATALPSYRLHRGAVRSR